MTATPSNIKRGYVDTPEGQIHYQTGGEGNDVLVLIHQNPSASTMWNPVLPLFVAKGWRVYAFDTPGYGNSDKPAEKSDIPYYARRFVEALDILGVDKFSALGHHSGAIIVSEMAASNPDRVLKVVGSGYPRLQPEGREYLKHTQPQEWSKDGHELLEIWTAGEGEAFDPELRLRTLLSKIQAGRDWFWVYHAVGATDPKELARRVTQPTLVIAGRGDGLLVGSERAVEKEFPNAKLIVIEGAGSNTPDEVPEVFVNHIDAFLRE